MGICGAKSAGDVYRREDSEGKACGSKSKASAGPGGDSDSRTRCSDGIENLADDGYGDYGSGLDLLSSVAMETSWRRVRLIHDTWGNISDVYSLESTKLGQGAFGYVCKGTSKETGSDRAIKSLSKARAKDTRKRYRQEIVTMKLTDHPNIVKLFETFEDKQHVFLVMELCQGGDLYTRLQAVSRFKEKEAATVMQQILRPVFYLHEKHICHRDLKPENFLFLNKGPVVDNTLKIIDFGFSCVFKEGKMLTTKLGTPWYSSPQVLVGQYDQSCDLWSCGVIMYVLLSGQPPFQGKNDAEVMQNVKRGNYAFKGSVWDKASDDAKDMVRKLLKYQPQERCTAPQALRLPFISTWIPQVSRLGELLTPSLLMDLRTFCAQSMLRRAALQIVAQQMSQEDTKAFRKAFNALDRKGSGILTVSELKDCVAQEETTEIRPMLDQVILELGNSGEAQIGFTEFLAATVEARHYLQEGAVRAAFRTFDLNGDGRITQNELEDVLLGTSHTHSTPPVSPMAMPPPKVRADDVAQISALLKLADTNGDGAIDFQEFYTMLGGDSVSAV